MSVIYGILYLCFVAFPIVFSKHRGWAAGTTGLSYLGIGIGTICAIASEPLLRRFINSRPRHPETGKVQPEASALIMAVGGVLTSVGILAFSWTSLPANIHWAAPITSGIPFGAGNTISYIYGSNYIANAYGIYAASALTGSAVTRSIFGGLLPLGGTAMYEKLTPQWAGTLLGLIEAALLPVPFIFWQYGAKLRARSQILGQIH